MNRKVKDIDIFNSLEENDRILYNGRAQPLKVEEVKDDEIRISGPAGGEYILFVAEEQKRVLVAKPGNRDYASYIGDTLKVGQSLKLRKKKPAIGPLNPKTSTLRKKLISRFMVIQTESSLKKTLRNLLRGALKVSVQVLYAIMYPSKVLFLTSGR